MTETKKIVFNNEQKDILFMFVNSKFTINDCFCLNPGSAFKQAIVIIIFVNFIFLLNSVFVQKVLSADEQIPSKFIKKCNLILLEESYETLK